MDVVAESRSLRWIAASSSLGAGAVHAAAIGAHAEHPQVVKAFTVLAVLQLGWGALALVRQSRWIVFAGALINAGAVGGWVMAKTAGVSFIDGMETSEPVQWADGLCAALALVATFAAFAMFVSSIRSTEVAPRAPRPMLQRASASVAAIVAVLAITGMNAAATHHHDGEGAVHSHGAEDVAAGHDHGTTDTTAPVVVAPKPYLATTPVDLGGVDGVTPEQQTRAEQLVDVTLAKLPQFADVSTLEAKGYHSIHDGGTGHEHYINWDLIGDGRELDPDYPESLVFDVRSDPGQKKLVSAMFMAEGGVTLDNVPDVGGPLTQWHIHDNLCYTESNPPSVAGITGPDGNCRPGLRKLGDPVPMIHVWITPHACGPFAALEGVAAGQVKPGETQACDTAHGATHSHS